MYKDTPLLLESLLILHGLSGKPIKPGTVFATLPPQEQCVAIEELNELPYPPLDYNNPGCIFNRDTRTLEATVWGKLVFSEEGISLSPCWQISNDNMLATVEIDHITFSGEKITQKDVMEHMPSALKTIALELDLSPINHALKKSAKSGQTNIVHIAEGTLPIPEQPARLALKFKTGQSAGTIREDGSIDFKERADMHSVKEEEVLGTLYPAVPGVPGKDIYGEEIPSQTVDGSTFKIGDGVEASEEDDESIIYTAAKAGVARYRNNTLEVTDLLKIDGDVDYNTGNIHAEHGSIHIRGDIKSGFKVESAEDIIVDGVVEKADIVAGGLVITGGVIMDGSNSIVAKGDVSAHFFHNAVVKSGGNVSADQDVSHCNITAAGSITVQGGKGIISGGHLVSEESIHANIIGSKSGVKTCVEIRVPKPSEKALKQAQKELKKELRSLDKAIGKDFGLSSLMNAPDEDRRILAELIKVRSRIQSEIRSMEESKNECILQADVLATKFIKADQKAYSGTKATICGASYNAKNAMESPCFRLDSETRKLIVD